MATLHPLRNWLTASEERPPSAPMQRSSLTSNCWDITTTPKPKPEPITSDIIRVPSAEEMEKGDKPEVIKADEIDDYIEKEKKKKEQEAKAKERSRQRCKRRRRHRRRHNFNRGKKS